MKREIKFRGKRTGNSGWIYGMPTYDFKYIFNGEQLDSIDNYEVIPETIGQFTGLKDKNGVEIYEGDIIEFVTFFTKDIVAEQVWIDEDACLHPFLDPFYIGDEQGAGLVYETIKVIGNIHDKQKQ